MSLKDTTRRTRFSKTITVTQPLDIASAEWIAEAPSTCTANGRCRAVPLNQFGTVTFTNAAAIADGHPGTISDPAWMAAPIELIASGGGGRFFGRGDVLGPGVGAVPGDLSSDGRSFSVAWQQNVVPRRSLRGTPLATLCGHRWPGWTNSSVPSGRPIGTCAECDPTPGRAPSRQSGACRAVCTIHPLDSCSVWRNPRVPAWLAVRVQGLTPHGSPGLSTPPGSCRASARPTPDMSRRGMASGRRTPSRVGHGVARTTCSRLLCPREVMSAGVVTRGHVGPLSTRGGQASGMTGPMLGPTLVSRAESSMRRSRGDHDTHHRAGRRAHARACTSSAIRAASRRLPPRHARLRAPLRAHDALRASRAFA